MLPWYYLRHSSLSSDYVSMTRPWRSHFASIAIQTEMENGVNQGYIPASDGAPLPARGAYSSKNGVAAAMSDLLMYWPLAAASK